MPGCLDVRDAMRLIAAIEAGIKPVAKLEGQGDESLRRWKHKLETEHSDLTWTSRRSLRSGEGAWEVFGGKNADDVEEALSLTEQSESERDPTQLERVTSRLGVLFGYPECCAEAFSKESHFLRDNNEWLRVKRRLKAPEKVSSEVHPMLTGFTPCSLTCQKTLDLMNSMSRLDPTVQLRRWPRLPTVILLDAPGQFAALEPLGEVHPSGFDFDIGLLRGDDPRLTSLEASETLVIAAGRITTYRANTLKLELGEVAFIWWAKAIFDRPIWETRLAERESTPADESSAIPPIENLRRALTRLAQHPRKPLRGFRPHAIEDHGGQKTKVYLRRGEDSFDLLLLPEDQCPSAIASSGGIAVVHDRETTVAAEELRIVSLIVLKAALKFL